MIQLKNQKKIITILIFFTSILQISFSQSTNLLTEQNQITRYKKEYIQDYIPIDKPQFLESIKEDIDIKIENPNEVDNNNVSLLMKAAKNGNDWEVSQLIALGADVNLKDNQNWTALMYAVRFQENVNIVDMILTAGADVKCTNSFGNSALIIAAYYNNNPEILKRLVEYYDSSSKELLKAFVLLITSDENKNYMQTSKLNVFINHSTPINSFYNGKTPLMYAAKFCKSTDTIKLLLENDAIITLRSTEGKTAFDYAKENANLAHDKIYWALNNN